MVWPVKNKIDSQTKKTYATGLTFPTHVLTLRNCTMFTWKEDFIMHLPCGMHPLNSFFNNIAVDMTCQTLIYL